LFLLPEIATLSDIEERRLDNPAQQRAVSGGDGAYVATSRRAGETATHVATSRRAGETAAHGASARTRSRRRRWRTGTGDRAVASVDALISRAEELSRASGKTEDEAAAGGGRDLESAAAALTTRTAPLVPGTGVLVAISGLAVKAEPTSRPLVQVFISFAIFFAIAGFAFLTRALFLYAGRRIIGLAPTVDDIAFARNRLVRKHTSAHRGGLLAGIGLMFLIIGILAGVQVTI
jgi:hypothetical protein